MLLIFNSNHQTASNIVRCVCRKLNRKYIYYCDALNCILFSQNIRYVGQIVSKVSAGKYDSALNYANTLARQASLDHWIPEC